MVQENLGAREFGHGKFGLKYYGNIIIKTKAIRRKRINGRL